MHIYAFVFSRVMTCFILYYIVGHIIVLHIHVLVDNQDEFVADGGY